jgi:hypothetical protein
MSDAPRHPGDAWPSRYARLLTERASGITAPDIPLDVMAALAEGRYAGEDRLALLERILAHPDTARELQLLRALAAQAPSDSSGPIDATVPVGDTLAVSASAKGRGQGWRHEAPVRRRRWSVPAWAGVAAAVVILLVGTSVWNPARRDGGGSTVPPGEAMRGESAVAITHPAPGGDLHAGDTVRWAPVPDATGYRLELVSSDGALVATQVVPDPTWVIPESVTLVSAQRYQLLLTHLLADGTERRTPAVTVIGGAR